MYNIFRWAALLATSSPALSPSLTIAAWLVCVAWRHCVAVSVWRAAPDWPPLDRPCCSFWCCAPSSRWARPWSRSWCGIAATDVADVWPAPRDRETNDTRQSVSIAFPAPFRLVVARLVVVDQVLTWQHWTSLICKRSKLPVLLYLYYLHHLSAQAPPAGQATVNICAKIFRGLIRPNPLWMLTNRLCYQS